MKIKFLLLGTSLSFLPTLTFAQCVATQDCVTLGYTETTCNGGKGGERCQMPVRQQVGLFGCK